MAKVASANPLVERALPYQEPGIVAILILSCFLYLLNLINHVLDQWVYCGLLGQVLVGVAWGAPGAQWLDKVTQQVLTQLGYLGLLLLVYEGGLSTSLSSLKANLFLSVAVATTGICLPIGLSFSLLRLGNATPLQAFAAGAALCSTSLGTTLTLLKTSALTKSRLGVVLTSAAMMDDVVGLVMVQIIANLKPGGAKFDAATVVRPVFVSLAFAILVPLCARFILLPCWRCFESSKALQVFKPFLQRPATPFVLHTTLLLALVTGSSYAGTSNLFAAYLTGALISWWDDVIGTVAALPDQLPVLAANTNSKDDSQGKCANSAPGDNLNISQPEKKLQTPSEGSLIRDTTSGPAAPNCEPSVFSEPLSKATQTVPGTTETTLQRISSTGAAVYERYYLAVVDRILKPLFFASIGFSIPISQMFHGPVVWRGIIYACLMVLGKLVCGLWLVRFDCISALRPGRNKSEATRKPKHGPEARPTPLGFTAKSNPTLASPPNPKSLYPASILGSAMVARGEIGFLVSAIAQNNSIFHVPDPDPSSGGTNQDLFLIVTWAIMLCTVIGPVAVGLIVRRVRTLQSKCKGFADGGGRQTDPLGVWGLNAGG